jgi:hypothetical protein
MMIFAPIIAAATTLRGSSEDDKKRARELWDDVTYDWGAVTSLRADLAKTTFSNFFQKSDSDYYLKVVERKILDGMITFLDMHGIDTSDIQDRQAVILNNGILVQGGDLRADSLAVGPGARAKTESKWTSNQVGGSQ